MTASLLALTAAASAGVADFLAARAARRLAVTLVAAWAQTVGIAVCVLACFVTGGGDLSLRDAGMAALAGVAMAIGISALYGSLAIGPIGVTAPVAAVSGAAVPVLAAAILGESLARGQSYGLLLGLVAIPLLAHAPADASQPQRPARGIAIALLAGLGIGGFTILLDVTPAAAGLWPVVVARVAAALVLWIIAAAGRSMRAPDRSDWALLVPCGVLDGLAVAAFLLALHGGNLAIVAVLAAFYPAATIALAMLIDRERLRPIQWAGLLAAAAAIAMII